MIELSNENMENLFIDRWGYVKQSLWDQLEHFYPMKRSRSLVINPSDY
jgi:hypothetical protein